MIKGIFPPPPAGFWLFYVCCPLSSFVSRCAEDWRLPPVAQGSGCLPATRNLLVSSVNPIVPDFDVRLSFGQLFKFNSGKFMAGNGTEEIV